MISPARPLPIETDDDALPVPPEAIELVAALLLEVVDAEDSEKSPPRFQE